MTLYSRAVSKARPYLEFAERQARVTCDSRRALDVGFGSGEATIFLLEHQWSVVAVDNDLSAIGQLEARIQGSPRPADCTVIHADVVDLVPTQVGLVHAGYVMQYVHPKQFEATWETLSRSVVEGGVFAGHFFGPEDIFALDPRYSIFDEIGCRTLFRDWRILLFETFLGPGQRNPERLWHFYTVVACKLPA